MGEPEVSTQVTYCLPVHIPINYPNRASDAAEHPHLIDGEFQSDKYPTCPRGKVPLSVKDKSAQDLLWEYAQRRRAVDKEFADDLEHALKGAGFVPLIGGGQVRA
jgi:hypothetical protein